MLEISELLISEKLLGFAIFAKFVDGRPALLPFALGDLVLDLLSGRSCLVLLVLDVLYTGI